MLLAGRCLAGSCQEGQACGTVARWELLVGSCQEGHARGTVARCELLAGSCHDGQARGTVARRELPGCQQQNSNRRLETATASIIGVLAEDGRPHRTWCGAEHGARWPSTGIVPSNVRSAEMPKRNHSTHARSTMRPAASTMAILSLHAF